MTGSGRRLFRERNDHCASAQPLSGSEIFPVVSEPAKVKGIRLSLAMANGSFGFSALRHL